jgi:penicillin-binding protein 1A
MTGGSLPAQTWHEIMAYAHQGIELKQIPGLSPQPATAPRAALAEGKKESTPDASPSRPSVLTKRGADALIRVERLMDDATRGLATRGESTKASNETTPRPQGTFASASDQQPASQVRGD